MLISYLNIISHTHKEWTNAFDFHFDTAFCIFDFSFSMQQYIIFTAAIATIANGVNAISKSFAIRFQFESKQTNEPTYTIVELFLFWIFVLLWEFADRIRNEKGENWNVCMDFAFECPFNWKLIDLKSE